MGGKQLSHFGLTPYQIVLDLIKLLIENISEPFIALMPWQNPYPCLIKEHQLKSVHFSPPSIFALPKKLPIIPVTP